eukprot:Skav216335  [mRNA]  locus=scaffold3350:319832:324838:+ [translate_table: standard]
MRNWDASRYNLEDLLALPAPAATTELEVTMTTQLSKNVMLNSPLVSAPMDTVTEGRMAIACALMGGLGVIHCRCPIAEQAQQVDMVKKYENGFIMDPFVLSSTHTVADIDQIRQAFDGPPKGKDLGHLLAFPKLKARHKMSQHN